jgi:hypothetical protein
VGDYARANANLLARQYGVTPEALLEGYAGYVETYKRGLADARPGAKALAFLGFDRGRWR